MSMNVIDRVALAEKKRNFLLILWLLTLPWRIRNFIECRIGRSSTANVFKEPVNGRI